MKIKRALEEVAAEAQKDGYGFEYMRNIRDGSLEMRIFKGRFGERVTLPVREVVAIAVLPGLVRTSATGA